MAEILARYGVTDPVTLQAAVLHDTLEDTETTPEELEREFGPAVRDVVVEVTDDKSLPKEVRKARQVETAGGLSDRARLIRIADKVSNVHDVTHAPPDWTLERRLEYLAWTRQVVERCRGVNTGLERCYDDVLAEGRARLAGPGEGP